MATEVIAGTLGEIRTATAAGGGDAVSTNPAVVVLPAGTQWIHVEGRNFTTAVVLQWALCPYLSVFKTADALATVSDYSSEAQDGSTSTDVTLSSLDTAANLDYLYLGAHQPFRGVIVDVDAANGNASVLSGDYRKSDATWAALSVTDGTASGGATFAVDGNITWTMPTDWVAATLAEAVATTGVAVPNRYVPRYWVRLKVSAALDSSTTLNSLVALARSTAYAEFVAGRSFEERITRGPDGYAAIEHKVDAGTGSIIVNVAANATVGFA